MTIYTGMMTEDEFLEQSGVKGMQWGVRKSETKTSKPTSETVLVKKLNNGGSVTITKDPPFAIVKLLSKISPRYKEGADKAAFFTLTNEKGQKVGDASFRQDSPTSLNLTWLGIKNAHRGNGYASAAMEGVVKYASDKGLSKLTLEVPGNAPDALHIYEKLGFKKVEVQSNAEIDPFWGGLTDMEYLVPQRTLVHSSGPDLELVDYIMRELNNMPDELEQSQDFDMMTEDEFLEHFGKKGMKWGIRKAPELAGSSTAISKPVKPPLTPEQAARRKKMLIGAAAVAATLIVVGGAYVAYDAHTVNKLKGVLATGELSFEKIKMHSPQADRLMVKGTDFTRRSYQSNAAWPTPLRTYAIEGGDDGLISKYGNKVYKFKAARDVRIAGLDTQLGILKGAKTAGVLRQISAEEHAKYSLSGRKYIKKVLSDDQFAKISIEQMRRSAWDGGDTGSPMTTKYASILKNMNYAAVNDLNLPETKARVLLDSDAFARL